MMRCKCGKWSNYGFTCTSCRMAVSVVDTDEDEANVEDAPSEEELETDLDEETE